MSDPGFAAAGIVRDSSSPATMWPVWAGEESTVFSVSLDSLVRTALATRAS